MDAQQRQDSHPGRVVARLAGLMARDLRALDLTLPQYRVLAYLSEGQAAASALAGRLDVSRPSVTALVDGLVARGLVERAADPDDRRRVHHLLTDAGRTALAEADDVVTERLDQVTGQLGRQEARLADDGLAAWGKGLRRYREAVR